MGNRRRQQQTPKNRKRKSGSRKLNKRNAKGQALAATPATVLPRATGACSDDELGQIASPQCPEMATASVSSSSPRAKVRCRSLSSSPLLYSQGPDFRSLATAASSSVILPMAVYRPTSLFVVLLVASILPKNAFSLRWLALSCGETLDVNSGSAGWRVLLQARAEGEKKGHGSSFPLFVLASDHDGEDTRKCQGTGRLTRVEKLGCSYPEGGFHWDSMWQRAAQSLKNSPDSINEASNLIQNRLPAELSHETRDDSFSVLDFIPRGGATEGKYMRNGNAPSPKNDIEPQYSGLINLGNTCYLNAQLQCAYHVPYLRQLVLEAKDKKVEVEVEIDVKIEDDGIAEKECLDQEPGRLDPSQEQDEEPENESSEAPMEETPSLQKKVVLKTELHPISNALRALQHTFASLSTGSSSSGTTHTLVRSLGINPFIQQDGQEFWKLFIPEVDSTEIAQLYSGYFEDYVREIVSPDIQGMSASAAGDYGEEKKEDEANIYEEGRAGQKPRERIRTEPFLDLSIPVTEGAGGAVEFALREMFTQPEILRVSEGNGWRPSAGAEKVNAYKGSSLKSEGLPPLLQLHLKRFKYDWETGETSKINDRFSFPLELDLSDLCHIGDQLNAGNRTEDSDLYDLQSIVIHKGEYGSGHYYSYVRPNIRSNEWFRFDDQLVTRVDYNDVVADAYGGQVRRQRSASVGSGLDSRKQQRGLLRRIFSFGFTGRPGLSRDDKFGYGGRSSSAYMLQYARRSEIPRLYLEDSAQQ